MSDTITRCVTFRVATVEGYKWKEFMDVLHSCWRQSTDLYNFATRSLLLQDNPRLPQQTKIPKFPKRSGESLYLECAKVFGDLPTSTIASITRDAQRYYIKHRNSYWKGNEGIPLKKYPAPFPIHNEKWTPFMWNDQRPAIKFATGQPINKKNGKDWCLILAGNKGFSYQLNDFKKILSGEAVKGEMALYRQRANVGDNRSGFDASVNGGGNTVRYSIMCKIAIELPKPELKEAYGCLNLKTDPEAFWVAEHEGRIIHPWIFNGDELASWLGRAKEWQDKHAIYRQRIYEDMKLERRVHVGKKQQMLDNLDKRCDKHKKRIKTWIQQACAQIANYCVRQKIAAVMYDDTNKSYMPKFPWFQLKITLKNALEGRGIICGGTLGCVEDVATTEIEEMISI